MGKISDTIWLDTDSALVDEAMESGINHFLAKPEIIVRLKKYPRGNYRLLRILSYPETCGTEDIIRFELEKLGAEYYDLCLLELYEAHCRDQGRLKDCFDYIAAQRIAGRVLAVGLSFYGKTTSLKALLESYGECIGYCAFPLNYMDWTLRDAMGMCNVAKAAGCSVLALNHTKNGILDSMPEEYAGQLSLERPGSSPLSWCYAWLRAGDKADALLLECHSLAELKRHIAAAAENKALNGTEECTAMYLAGRLRNIENAAPCTGCGHCEGVCPSQLDIPYLVRSKTDLEFLPDKKRIREYLTLPESEQASACIGCCKCVISCPKMIYMPMIMAELDTLTKAETPHP